MCTYKEGSVMLNTAPRVSFVRVVHFSAVSVNHSNTYYSSSINVLLCVQIPGERSIPFGIRYACIARREGVEPVYRRGAGRSESERRH